MSEPGKVRSWNPDVRPEKLVSAILSVNSGILESGILVRVRRTMNVYVQDLLLDIPI